MKEDANEFIKEFERFDKAVDDWAATYLEHDTRPDAKERLGNYFLAFSEVLAKADESIRKAVNLAVNNERYLEIINQSFDEVHAFGNRIGISRREVHDVIMFVLDDLKREEEERKV
ncbi:hypothetical protein [Chroococcidiopsis sp. CCNUC1]|uniref:hypothetical protein n=1 Tax=Chroococcidiopsis sp. CCNUC1 TaxID=2653189 RepID=UPI002021A8FB|nr:hypothetical protein [Chroococcidiopsis sp. CCNUC1]URD50734.1 hypothetical protein M5J74_01815 [Chroococcidiopsis sp. CCNUC1]